MIKELIHSLLMAKSFVIFLHLQLISEIGFKREQNTHKFIQKISKINVCKQDYQQYFFHEQISLEDFVLTALKPEEEVL